jgi:hypothetical protein
MGTLSLEDSSDEEEDFESAPKMSAQALADLLDLPYPPKPIKIETKACFKMFSKSAGLKAALLTRKK